MYRLVSMIRHTYHRVLGNNLQHSFGREQDSEEEVDPVYRDPRILKSLRKIKI